MGLVQWSQVLAFLVAAEALLIVPGPSVLFVVSRGVTYGRRAALATVAGNTAGSAVQAILVAVGLGAVVATSTTVFTAMKLAGGAYLVFLGLRAWADRRTLVEALRRGDEAPVRPPAQLLRDGFLVWDYLLRHPVKTGVYEILYGWDRRARWMPVFTGMTGNAPDDG